MPIDDSSTTPIDNGALTPIAGDDPLMPIGDGPLMPTGDGSPMPLTDEVRTTCAQIATRACSVRIDLDAAAEVRPAQPPALDRERHYLEGDAADVADYMLALDAINF